MRNASLNPIKLAEALSAMPDFRYVLVGGMAVIMHGGARVTLDADLAIAYTAENRRRLVEALAPLNPRPVRGVWADWVWDEACVRGPWCSFLTDAGGLDLIIRLPGVDGFDGLYDRAIEFEIADGVRLRVASIEDLIAMKRTADRDRDRDDVRTLEAILKLNAE